MDSRRKQTKKKSFNVIPASVSASAYIRYWKKQKQLLYQDGFYNINKKKYWKITYTLSRDRSQLSPSMHSKREKERERE